MLVVFVCTFVFSGFAKGYSEFEPKIKLIENEIWYSNDYQVELFFQINEFEKQLYGCFLENKVKGECFKGEYNGKEIYTTLNGKNVYLNYAKNGNNFEGVVKDSLDNLLHKIEFKREGKSYKEIIESIELISKDDPDGYECNYDVLLKYFNGAVHGIETSGQCGSNLTMIFEDFNFDGHPDLRITADDDLDVNQNYDMYTYSLVEGVFVKRFKGVTSPLVNYAQKVLFGITRVSYVEQEIDVFDFNKDEFVRYYFDYSSDEGGLIIYDANFNRKLHKPLNKDQYKELLGKLMKVY